MKYVYTFAILLIIGCNGLPQTETFHNNNFSSVITINNDSLTYKYKIGKELFNQNRFRRNDDIIYFNKWKDRADVSIYDCVESSCIAAPAIYPHAIIFSEDEEIKNFYKNEE